MLNKIQKPDEIKKNTVTNGNSISLIKKKNRLFTLNKKILKITGEALKTLSISTTNFIYSFPATRRPSIVRSLVADPNKLQNLNWKAKCGSI